ncbi:MAG: hypothetical protein ACI9AX_002944 [Polaromonas sp.]|jgi:uncharacterized protein YjiS (DUF1127 family)
MAVFEYIRPAAGTRGLMGQISALFSDAVSTLISWNDARVTRNSLSGLSNRELDDLGLVRGDIEDIAQGAYRR